MSDLAHQSVKDELMNNLGKRCAALRAENERLRAALRRLLATINPGNAHEHEPGCGCVIHEARRAVEQKAPEPSEVTVRRERSEWPDRQSPEQKEPETYDSAMEREHGPDLNRER